MNILKEKNKLKCKYCKKRLKEDNLEEHEKDCSKSPNVNGLGGWLIFIQIGFWIGLIQSFEGLDSDTWFISVFFILFLIYSLFLMYTKNYKFPLIGIILYAINTIIVIILYFIIGEVSFLIEIPKAIIWITYLIKSKRVRNTFING